MSPGVARNVNIDCVQCGHAISWVDVATSCHQTGKYDTYDNGNPEPCGPTGIVSQCMID